MTKKNIYKGIRNPKKAIKTLFNIFLNKHASLIKNDELYLKLRWWANMDYPLNLDNPRTFNEKIQWLKLHNHKSEYTMMVDKVEAKKYVANIIGEEYIIPTLAVYNTADEIDFEKLPDQFVLKCTHDSADIVICRDKSRLDFEEARRKMAVGLKRNYYWKSREWPYKNVKPRIIAEKYMSSDGDELIDYKWFCFEGEPQYMFIATDRFNKSEDTKFDFYDMNFQHLPFTNGHPNAKRTIEKPLSFETMKALAGRLSEGMPHVRVDFYDINGHVYFGEMTFSHWSGMVPFVPRKWDFVFGEQIKLPK